MWVLFLWQSFIDLLLSGETCEQWEFSWKQLWNYVEKWTVLAGKHCPSLVWLQGCDTEVTHTELMLERTPAGTRHSIKSLFCGSQICSAGLSGGLHDNVFCWLCKVWTGKRKTHCLSNGKQTLMFWTKNEQAAGPETSASSLCTVPE